MVETLVAILLATTIGYCVILNQRLKRLHADRDQLRKMVADLVQATTLANAAIGVPMPSKYLAGFDSLLSMVQMPGGIPVATLAIGVPGATNAGILAASILATSDEALAQRLIAFRTAQTESVAEKPV